MVKLEKTCLSALGLPNYTRLELPYMFISLLTMNIYQWIKFAIFMKMLNIECEKL